MSGPVLILLHQKDPLSVYVSELVEDATLPDYSATSLRAESTGVRVVSSNLANNWNFYANPSSAPVSSHLFPAYDHPVKVGYVPSQSPHSSRRRTIKATTRAVRAATLSSSRSSKYSTNCGCARNHALAAIPPMVIASLPRNKLRCAIRALNAVIAPYVNTSDHTMSRALLINTIDVGITVVE